MAAAYLRSDARTIYLGRLALDGTPDGPPGVHREGGGGVRTSFTSLIPALFVLLWITGFLGARLGMPHAEPMMLLVLAVGGVALVNRPQPGAANVDGRQEEPS